jgi:hypothetical protein
MDNTKHCRITRRTDSIEQESARVQSNAAIGGQYFGQSRFSCWRERLRVSGGAKARLCYTSLYFSFENSVAPF